MTIFLPGDFARSVRRSRWLVAAIGCSLLTLTATAQTQQKTAPVSAAPATKKRVPPQAFATAQEAADALITAAERFDVPDLKAILGTDGDDLIDTGEQVQDREAATGFAAQARDKSSVLTDPKRPSRAILSVGKADWPLPIPIIKQGAKWQFDAKAGRKEILYRRIGRNELDAIAICRGFVDAQREYSFSKRAGARVNQYAQRIISTPGKQDGLAWKNPDGSWGGPIGNNAAHAIEQGYAAQASPYHGYYFKVLKGQGAAAPLGELDFVVNGVMIGGFALAAAPAEYGVTGVKTFIVSHDGVVHEKDLGEKTLSAFKAMERYNPTKGWTRVLEE
jgi:Protein of unknown function (DUF2950)